MVVIGYGIAALIVVVLLIVFNVRAVSNRARRADTDNGEPTPERAAAEAPMAQHGVAVSRPQPPDGTESMDESYRNAMRQWRTGSPKGNSAAGKKSSTSDAEYREAMRKLMQSNDRKK